MSDIRVGHGIDVHRFASGRPLILGGVEVPHGVGLLGHSDADVLLHALIDSVLGALGWGDIGGWFPDTDPAFKDADSTKLFAHVWREAEGKGWRLGNADIVVLAERPKLAPFIPSMRRTIATLFHADEELVSIKATTTETLGFVGREEGILATATVLLRSSVDKG